ncbi:MAG TPA: hypothetical protein VFJ82_02795 [Longimicrobium sp.]|nr:hypothetical protein [Longimicrobium sp.]
MADPAIPEEIQRFLADHVASAEELDALMLLHAQRDRAWTPEALSQALFSVPQSAALTLERLEAKGLAEAAGGTPPAWRYAATGEADDRIAALGGVYRANRAAVIKHLFARRVDPVRSLADAFRLRKDR